MSCNDKTAKESNWRQSLELYGGSRISLSIHFFFFFAFLIIGAKTEYVKKELEGARRLQTVSESRGQPGAVWGLVRFEPEHPHHR